MTIAILVAPATRIGYLLYPVDFFIFAWLLRSEDLSSPSPPPTDAEGTDRELVDRVTTGEDAVPDNDALPVPVSRR
jgi:hypothetical protein